MLKQVQHDSFCNFCLSKYIIIFYFLIKYVNKIFNFFQIIFRENVEPMLVNKHVVLLLASATTGQTILQSVQAIKYYGGTVEGVSAIFSAVDQVGDINVDSIFTIGDVEGYTTYSALDCPFCKKQQKLDAIVNSFGYSKI